MAAAPVVIAAMEPAQSVLTSRKSWPKIRCCSPSQDLEAVEGKERQNRANITNSVCYPGLRQGRGGAWDHRRCGACFCWLATTLPSASSDKAPRAQSQHVTATLHASNATTLARPQTLKMPKALRGSLDQALRPQPSVVKGVSACRLSKPKNS